MGNSRNIQHTWNPQVSTRAKQTGVGAQAAAIPWKKLSEKVVCSFFAFVLAFGLMVPYGGLQPLNAYANDEEIEDQDVQVSVVNNPAIDIVVAGKNSDTLVNNIAEADPTEVPTDIMPTGHPDGKPDTLHILEGDHAGWYFVDHTAQPFKDAAGVDRYEFYGPYENATDRPAFGTETVGDLPSPAGYIDGENKAHLYSMGRLQRDISRILTDNYDIDAENVLSMNVKSVETSTGGVDASSPDFASVVNDWETLAQKTYTAAFADSDGYILTRADSSISAGSKGYYKDITNLTKDDAYIQNGKTKVVLYRTKIVRDGQGFFSSYSVKSPNIPVGTSVETLLDPDGPYKLVGAVYSSVDGGDRTGQRTDYMGWYGTGLMNPEETEADNIEASFHLVQGGNLNEGFAFMINNEGTDEDTIVDRWGNALKDSQNNPIKAKRINGFLISYTSHNNQAVRTLWRVDNYMLDHAFGNVPIGCGAGYDGVARWTTGNQESALGYNTSVRDSMSVGARTLVVGNTGRPYTVTCLANWDDDAKNIDYKVSYKDGIIEIVRNDHGEDDDAAGPANARTFGATGSKTAAGAATVPSIVSGAVHFNNQRDTDEVVCRLKQVYDENTGKTSYYNVDENYENPTFVKDVTGPAIEKGTYGFWGMNCEQGNQALVTNLNVSINKTVVKSFGDIVYEPDWTPGALHFLVNIDGEADDTMSNAKYVSENATRLMDKDVHLVQWGSDANRAGAQTLIDRTTVDNKTSGIFLYDLGKTSSDRSEAGVSLTYKVNDELSRTLGRESNAYESVDAAGRVVDSEGNVTINDRRYYTGLLNKTVRYMVDQIGQNVTYNTVYVNEPFTVNVKPESLKDNAVSNNYESGRWRYYHNPTYYENSEGYDQYVEKDPNSTKLGWSQYSPSMQCLFKKPGLYEVTFDDKKVVEVLAQRRAFCDFTMVVDPETEKLTLESTSYDLDQYSKNKGIASEVWTYTETTEKKVENPETHEMETVYEEDGVTPVYEVSDWIKGKPDEIDLDRVHTYAIRLTVTDHQGDVETATKFIGAGAPAAGFTLDSKSLDTQSKFKVTNTSYDPSGKNGIEEYRWTLYKSNNLKVGTVNETPYEWRSQDPEFPADLDLKKLVTDVGAGTYRLGLVVATHEKDKEGNITDPKEVTSLEFFQSFNVSNAKVTNTIKHFAQIPNPDFDADSAESETNVRYLNVPLATDYVTAESTKNYSVAKKLLTKIPAGFSKPTKFKYIHKDEGASAYVTTERNVNSSSVANGATLRQNDNPDTIEFYYPLSDYTVNYNVNGGSFARGVKLQRNYTAGSEVKIPSPTRPGYNFVGWKDTRSADKEFLIDENDPSVIYINKGADITKATTVEELNTAVFGATTGNLNLKAIWEVKKPNATTEVGDIKSPNPDGTINVGDKISLSVKVTNSEPETVLQMATLEVPVPDWLAVVPDSMKLTVLEKGETEKIDVQPDAYKDETNTITVFIGNVDCGTEITLTFDAEVLGNAAGKEFSMVPKLYGHVPANYTVDGDGNVVGDAVEDTSGTITGSISRTGRILDDKDNVVADIDTNKKVIDRATNLVLGDLEYDATSGDPATLRGKVDRTIGRIMDESVVVTPARTANDLPVVTTTIDRAGKLYVSGMEMFHFEWDAYTANAYDNLDGSIIYARSANEAVLYTAQKEYYLIDFATGKIYKVRSASAQKPEADPAGYLTWNEIEFVDTEDGESVVAILGEDGTLTTDFVGPFSNAVGKINAEGRIVREDGSDTGYYINPFGVLINNNGGTIGKMSGAPSAKINTSAGAVIGNLHYLVNLYQNAQTTPAGNLDINDHRTVYAMQGKTVKYPDSATTVFDIYWGGALVKDTKVGKTTTTNAISEIAANTVSFTYNTTVAGDSVSVSNAVMDRDENTLYSSNGHEIGYIDPETKELHYNATTEVVATCIKVNDPDDSSKYKWYVKYICDSEPYKTNDILGYIDMQPRIYDKDGNLIGTITEDDEGNITSITVKDEDGKPVTYYVDPESGQLKDKDGRPIGYIDPDTGNITNPGGTGGGNVGNDKLIIKDGKVIGYYDDEGNPHFYNDEGGEDDGKTEDDIEATTGEDDGGNVGESTTIKDGDKEIGEYTGFGDGDDDEGEGDGKGKGGELDIFGDTGQVGDDGKITGDDGEKHGDAVTDESTGKIKTFTYDGKNYVVDLTDVTMDIDGTPTTVNKFYKESDYNEGTFTGKAVGYIVTATKKIVFFDTTYYVDPDGKIHETDDGGKVTTPPTPGQIPGGPAGDEITGVDGDKVTKIKHGGKDYFVDPATNLIYDNAQFTGDIKGWIDKENNIHWIDPDTVGEMEDGKVTIRDDKDEDGGKTGDDTTVTDGEGNEIGESTDNGDNTKTLTINPAKAGGDYYTDGAGKVHKVTNIGQIKFEGENNATANVYDAKGKLAGPATTTTADDKITVTEFALSGKTYSVNYDESADPSYIFNIKDAAASEIPHGYFAAAKDKDGKLIANVMNIFTIGDVVDDQTYYVDDEGGVHETDEGGTIDDEPDASGVYQIKDDKGNVVGTYTPNGNGTGLIYHYGDGDASTLEDNAYYFANALGGIYTATDTLSNIGAVVSGTDRGTVVTDTGHTGGSYTVDNGEITTVFVKSLNKTFYAKDRLLYETSKCEGDPVGFIDSRNNIFTVGEKAGQINGKTILFIGDKVGDMNGNELDIRTGEGEGGEGGGGTTVTDGEDKEIGEYTGFGPGTGEEGDDDGKGKGGELDIFGDTGQTGENGDITGGDGEKHGEAQTDETTGKIKTFTYDGKNYVVDLTDVTKSINGKTTTVNNFYKEADYNEGTFTGKPEGYIITATKEIVFNKTTYYVDPDGKIHETDDGGQVTLPPTAPSNITGGDKPGTVDKVEKGKITEITYDGKKYYVDPANNLIYDNNKFEGDPKGWIDRDGNIHWIKPGTVGEMGEGGDVTIRDGEDEQGGGEGGNTITGGEDDKPIGGYTGFGDGDDDGDGDEGDGDGKLDIFGGEGQVGDDDTIKDDEGKEHGKVTDHDGDKVAKFTYDGITYYVKTSTTVKETYEGEKVDANRFYKTSNFDVDASGYVILASKKIVFYDSTYYVDPEGEIFGTDDGGNVNVPAKAGDDIKDDDGNNTGGKVDEVDPETGKVTKFTDGKGNTYLVDVATGKFYNEDQYVDGKFTGKPVGWIDENGGIHYIDYTDHEGTMGPDGEVNLNDGKDDEGGQAGDDDKIKDGDEEKGDVTGKDGDKIKTFTYDGKDYVVDTATTASEVVDGALVDVNKFYNAADYNESDSTFSGKPAGYIVLSNKKIYFYNYTTVGEKVTDQVNIVKDGKIIGVAKLNADKSYKSVTIFGDPDVTYNVHNGKLYLTSDTTFKSAKGEIDASGNILWYKGDDIVEGTNTTTKKLYDEQGNVAGSATVDENGKIVEFTFEGVDYLVDAKSAKSEFYKKSQYSATDKTFSGKPVGYIAAGDRIVFYEYTEATNTNKVKIHGTDGEGHDIIIGEATLNDKGEIVEVELYDIDGKGTHAIYVVKDGKLYEKSDTDFENPKGTITASGAITLFKGEETTSGTDTGEHNIYADVLDPETGEPTGEKKIVGTQKDLGNGTAKIILRDGDKEAVYFKDADNKLYVWSDDEENPNPNGEAVGEIDPVTGKIKIYGDSTVLDRDKDGNLVIGGGGIGKTEGGEGDNDILDDEGNKIGDIDDGKIHVRTGDDDPIGGIEDGVLIKDGDKEIGTLTDFSDDEGDTSGVLTTPPAYPGDKGDTYYVESRPGKIYDTDDGGNVDDTDNKHVTGVVKDINNNVTSFIYDGTKYVVDIATGKFYLESQLVDGVYTGRPVGFIDKNGEIHFINYEKEVGTAGTDDSGNPTITIKDTKEPGKITDDTTIKGTGDDDGEDIGTYHGNGDGTGTITTPGDPDNPNDNGDEYYVTGKPGDIYGTDDGGKADESNTHVTEIEKDGKNNITSFKYDGVKYLVDVATNKFYLEAQYDSETGKFTGDPKGYLDKDGNIHFIDYTDHAGTITSGEGEDGGYKVTIRSGAILGGRINSEDEVLNTKDAKVGMADFEGGEALKTFTYTHEGDTTATTYKADNAGYFYLASEFGVQGKLPRGQYDENDGAKIYFFSYSNGEDSDEKTITDGDGREIGTATTDEDGEIDTIKLGTTTYYVGKPDADGKCLLYKTAERKAPAVGEMDKNRNITLYVNETGKPTNDHPITDGKGNEVGTATTDTDGNILYVTVDGKKYFVDEVNEKGKRLLYAWSDDAENPNPNGEALGEIDEAGNVTIYDFLDGDLGWEGGLTGKDGKPIGEDEGDGKTGLTGGEIGTTDNPTDKKYIVDAEGNIIGWYNEDGTITWKDKDGNKNEGNTGLDINLTDPDTGKSKGKTDENGNLIVDGEDLGGKDGIYLVDPETGRIIGKVDPITGEITYFDENGNPIDGKEGSVTRDNEITDGNGNKIDGTGTDDEGNLTLGGDTIGDKSEEGTFILGGEDGKTIIGKINPDGTITYYNPYPTEDHSKDGDTFKRVVEVVDPDTGEVIGEKTDNGDGTWTVRIYGDPDEIYVIDENGDIHKATEGGTTEHPKGPDGKDVTYDPETPGTKVPATIKAGDDEYYVDEDGDIHKVDEGKVEDDTIIKDKNGKDIGTFHENGDDEPGIGTIKIGDDEYFVDDDGDIHKTTPGGKTDGTGKITDPSGNRDDGEITDNHDGTKTITFPGDPDKTYTIDENGKITDDDDTSTPKKTAGYVDGEGNIHWLVEPEVGEYDPETGKIDLNDGKNKIDDGKVTDEHRVTDSDGNPGTYNDKTGELNLPGNPDDPSDDQVLYVDGDGKIHETTPGGNTGDEYITGPNGETGTYDGDTKTITIPGDPDKTYKVDKDGIITDPSDNDKQVGWVDEDGNIHWIGDKTGGTYDPKTGELDIISGKVGEVDPDTGDITWIDPAATGEVVWSGKLTRANANKDVINMVEGVLDVDGTLYHLDFDGHVLNAKNQVVGYLDYTGDMWLDNGTAEDRSDDTKLGNLEWKVMLVGKDGLVIADLSSKVHLYDKNNKIKGELDPDTGEITEIKDGGNTEGDNGHLTDPTGEKNNGTITPEDEDGTRTITFPGDPEKTYHVDKDGNITDPDNDNKKVGYIDHEGNIHWIGDTTGKTTDDGVTTDKDGKYIGSADETFTVNWDEGTITNEKGEVVGYLKWYDKFTDTTGKSTTMGYANPGTPEETPEGIYNAGHILTFKDLKHKTGENYMLGKDGKVYAANGALVGYINFKNEICLNVASEYMVSTSQGKIYQSTESGRVTVGTIADGNVTITLPNTLTTISGKITDDDKFVDASGNVIGTFDTKKNEIVMGMSDIRIGSLSYNVELVDTSGASLVPPAFISASVHMRDADDKVVGTYDPTTGKITDGDGKELKLYPDGVSTTGGTEEKGTIDKDEADENGDSPIAGKPGGTYHDNGDGTGTITLATTPVETLYDDHGKVHETTPGGNTDTDNGHLTDPTGEKTDGTYADENGKKTITFPGDPDKVYNVDDEGNITDPDNNDKKVGWIDPEGDIHWIGDEVGKIDDDGTIVIDKGPERVIGSADDTFTLDWKTGKLTNDNTHVVVGHIVWWGEYFPYTSITPEPVRGDKVEMGADGRFTVGTTTYYVGQKGELIDNADDKVVGKVDPQGEVYLANADKTYTLIGHLDWSAKLYDESTPAQHMADLAGYTAVYDKSGKKIGEIDGEGNLTDEDGNPIGDIYDDGVTKGGDGKVIGTADDTFTLDWMTGKLTNDRTHAVIGHLKWSGALTTSDNSKIKIAENGLITVTLPDKNGEAGASVTKSYYLGKDGLLYSASVDKDGNLVVAKNSDGEYEEAGYLDFDSDLFLNDGTRLGNLDWDVVLVDESGAAIAEFSTTIVITKDGKIVGEIGDEGITIKGAHGTLDGKGHVLDADDPGENIGSYTTDDGGNVKTVTINGKTYYTGNLTNGILYLYAEPNPTAESTKLGEIEVATDDVLIYDTTIDGTPYWDGVMRDKDGNVIGDGHTRLTVLWFKGHIVNGDIKVGHFIWSGQLSDAKGTITGTVNGLISEIDPEKGIFHDYNVAGMQNYYYVDDKGSTLYKVKAPSVVTEALNALGITEEDPFVYDTDGNKVAAGYVDSNGTAYRYSEVEGAPDIEIGTLSWSVDGVNDKGTRLVHFERIITIRDAEGNIIGVVRPDGTIEDTEGNVIGSNSKDIPLTDGKDNVTGYIKTIKEAYTLGKLNGDATKIVDVKDADKVVADYAATTGSDIAYDHKFVADGKTYYVVTNKEYEVTQVAEDGSVSTTKTSKTVIFDDVKCTETHVGEIDSTTKEVKMGALKYITDVAGNVKGIYDEGTGDIYNIKDDGTRDFVGQINKKGEVTFYGDAPVAKPKSPLLGGHVVNGTIKNTSGTIIGEVSANDRIITYGEDEPIGRIDKGEGAVMSLVAEGETATKIGTYALTDAEEEYATIEIPSDVAGEPSDFYYAVGDVLYANPEHTGVPIGKVTDEGIIVKYGNIGHGYLDRATGKIYDSKDVDEFGDHTGNEIGTRAADGTLTINGEVLGIDDGVKKVVGPTGSTIGIIDDADRILKADDDGNFLSEDGHIVGEEQAFMLGTYVEPTLSDASGKTLAVTDGDGNVTEYKPGRGEGVDLKDIYDNQDPVPPTNPGDNPGGGNGNGGTTIKVEENKKPTPTPAPKPVVVPATFSVYAANANTGKVTLANGKSMSLKGTALLVNPGSNSSTATGVSYISSNPGIVKVTAAGKITADKKKTGTAKITIASLSNPANTKVITVKVVKKAKYKAAKKIKKTNIKTTYKVGQKVKVTAKWNPSAPSNKNFTITGKKCTIDPVTNTVTFTTKGKITLTVKSTMDPKAKLKVKVKVK